MVIVDTGVLYALADKRDAHHSRCLRWLKSVSESLLVPAPVVAEACYLIGDNCGAEIEAAFLESFGPGEAFTLANLTHSDMARMAELVRRYSDFPLGGTDACIVALAERLKITTVATVDIKHFSVVAPRHVSRLTLVP